MVPLVGLVAAAAAGRPTVGSIWTLSPSPSPSTLDASFLNATTGKQTPVRPPSAHLPSRPRPSWSKSMWPTERVVSRYT